MRNFRLIALSVVILAGDFVSVRDAASQPPDLVMRFNAAIQGQDVSAAVTAGKALLASYRKGPDNDPEDEEDLAAWIGAAIVNIGGAAQAIPFFEQGIELARRRGPRAARDVITATASLGMIQLQAKRINEGCATLKEAAAMWDELPQKEANPIALPLGACSMATADYDEAAIRLQQSKDEHTTIPHPMGAETAVPLESVPLFLAQWHARNLVKARAILESASMFWSDVVAASTGRGGAEESRAKNLGAVLMFMPSLATAFHFQEGPANSELARIAFEAVLRYKGILLETSTQLLNLTRRSTSPTVQKTLKRVLDLRTERARRSISLLDKGEEIATDTQVQGWLVEEDTLLQSLPATERPVHRPTLRDIEARLPAGTALIEFVRYATNVQELRGQNQGNLPPATPSFHYAAYVIAANQPLRWAELGPTERVDAQVQLYRQRIIRQAANADEPARALFDMLIAPVANDLKGVRRLMVSPDGPLSLLPMSALMDSVGDFWGHRVVVSYLVSGRDLLAPTSDVSSGAPVIIGAPTGDVGEPPLPGMKDEAEDIHRLLPNARVFLGAAATPAQLEAVKSPSILHIAAHGSYSRGAGPDGPKTVEEQLSEALVGSTITLAPERTSSAAGGNGKVTALQIAGLDLRGTKLAVLSACETAVGAPSTGDGIYGLRRALTLAGSRAQVLTLWRADDLATRAFMKAFYTKVLSCVPIAQALHDSQEAVRATPGWAHPYFWAGFIASGTLEQVCH